MICDSFDYLILKLDESFDSSFKFTKLFVVVAMV